jgi:hypothetical protein
VKPPKQEGIVFDNVRILHDKPSLFLSVSTPVDSVSFNNCTFKNGGITFVDNKAMKDYGPTKIQMNGCRFYSKGEFPVVRNLIKNKRVDIVTTGSMTFEPDFKAVFTGVKENFKISSDLPIKE